MSTASNSPHLSGMSSALHIHTRVNPTPRRTVSSFPHPVLQMLSCRRLAFSSFLFFAVCSCVSVVDIPNDGSRTDKLDRLGFDRFANAKQSYSAPRSSGRFLLDRGQDHGVLFSLSEVSTRECLSYEVLFTPNEGQSVTARVATPTRRQGARLVVEGQSGANAAPLPEYSLGV